MIERLIGDLSEKKQRNDDEQKIDYKKDKISKIWKNQTRRRGGVLRYPLEALTEHTDYLQIDIEKYEPIGDKLCINTR